MPGLPSYPHDTTSHRHWRFTKLRQKFGWEGEGRFWALANIIAAADRCYVDWSDDETKEQVAVELDFEKSADLDSFVAFLVGGCGLLTLENDKLANPEVRSHFERIKARRKMKNESYSRMRSGAVRLPLPGTGKTNVQAAAEMNREIEAHFEEWYGEYPLKKSRKKAFAIYHRIVSTKPGMAQVLLDAIIAENARRKEITDAGFQPKFIKHPTTWLNGECWHDELDAIPTGQPPRASRNGQGKISTNGTADEEV